MTSFKGYFLPAAIPNDPDRANKILAKIEQGEITIHPDCEKEVPELLRWVIDGNDLKQYPFHDLKQFPFNERAESAENDGNEEAFDRSLNTISTAIKKISPEELQSKLKEVFSELCGSEVSTDLRHLEIDFTLDGCDISTRVSIKDKSQPSDEYPF